MQELTQKLPQLKAFHEVPEVTLQDFIQICTVHSFTKDEMIFLPGEEEGKIYLVLDGEVKLYRSAGGRKAVLQVLKESDFFGDLSLAHPGTSLPLENFARAETDGRLCVIAKPDMEKFLNSHPKFALVLLNILRDRLHQAEGKIKDLAISPAQTRLINELIRQAVYHGRETERFLELEEKLTHEQLSEMVGVTRETVTKTLLNLKELGFVEYTPERKIRVNKDKVRNECVHCIQIHKSQKM